MANKAPSNASPASVVVDTEDVSHLLSGVGKSIPLFKVHLPESVLQPLNITLMSEYTGQGTPIITHQGRGGSLRSFNVDEVSQLWLSRVCDYLGLDDQILNDITST